MKDFLLALLHLAVTTAKLCGDHLRTTPPYPVVLEGRARASAQPHQLNARIPAVAVEAIAGEIPIVRSNVDLNVRLRPIEPWIFMDPENFFHTWRSSSEM